MLKTITDKIIRFHGISILCGIGIFILCVIKLPPQENLAEIPFFDKIVHFIMYLSFSLAVILETFTIKSWSEKSILRTYFAALSISAIFGGLIELIQGYLTEYRSADIIDWGFDMGGSLAACLMIELIRRAFRLRGR